MKKILVFIGLISCFVSYAQQPESIKLSQAVCHQLALQNSEDIRKQGNALQQAVLDQEIAKASYMPDIDASLMDVLMKDTKISDAMTLQMKGTYMAGISLTLPIYTGGQLTTGNKLAQVGVEVQKIQQEKTRRDVLYDADKAYFSYLAVRSKVNMLEAYMMQMDSLASMIKLSVGVEMATNSDLLRIDAKRSQIEYNLKKARNGVELCRMSLCASLGLDLKTQLDVDDKDLASITSPSVDPSIVSANTSLTFRPEYQLLQQGIKAKELEIRKARAGYLPTVALVAQYSQYGWAYMKGQQEGYSYKSEIYGGAPMLMATVSVPLWHWGKEAKRIRKAKFDLQNAQLDLQKNARLLGIQNQQALLNVQDSYRLIETAERGLTQATDNLKNLRLRFDNSMATLTDLLDAHSQWQEASSNLIEAKTQYKIYESEYKKLMGE